MLVRHIGRAALVSTIVMLTSKVEQPTDICQVFRIDGLSGQRMQYRAGSVLLREGRTSPLEAFPTASGQVGASGPVGISPAGFYRNMASFQALRISALLAFAALARSRFIGVTVVARSRAFERWQSPVDRARLEIV